MYFDPGLVDRLLPVAGRNHPTDIAGRPVTREISALHHDSRDCFHYRHCLRPERSFPVGRGNDFQPTGLGYLSCGLMQVAGDSSHVTLGQESLHSHHATIAVDEPADLFVPGKLR